MNQRLCYSILAIAFVSIFSYSCKKGIDSGWESSYLTPIVSGNLSILDMLPDSITQVNPDQSIDLVFQQNILDYNLAEESINVPDTSVDFYISLDSLKLDDRIITNSISLGAVATALGIPGLYIILNNGNNIVVSALAGLTSGEQPVDATSFFETATFNAGKLDVTIKNGFPIPLTNVHFVISNADAGDVVVDATFDTIHVGETVTQTTDLTGKTVEGSLIANIINFDTPGSAPDSVIIDTSDVILLTLKAYDMQLFSATAIFPEQNLVNNAGNVQYDLGGPELTEMKIQSGDVVVYVVNTMQDSIHIIYNLPYATNDLGESVYFETVVPPAPGPGEDTVITKVYPLDNYTVDLRGSYHDSYNTFYQEFSASIDSTGIVKTISLDDSLHVIYGLQDIVPLEVKGYVGQITQHIADTTSAVGIFEKIVGGEIAFGDVNIFLEIYNGIGVSGNFVINSLKARNTSTGAEVSLDAPTIIGYPQTINRALNDPFIPGISSLALNTANSNIDKLINILPDQLIYDVDMNINPNGNEYNYQDFINADSRIKIDLDLEMPLEFYANNLTLQDEFDVSIGSAEDNATTTTSDGLQSTELTLYADNGFPLDADIAIVFIDAFGAHIDSIDFGGAKIEPADIDPADCRAHIPKSSVLKTVVSADKLQHILDSKLAQLTVHFNTASAPTCSDKVKIYSDYSFEVHLVGDFDYIFSTKNF